MEKIISIAIINIKHQSALSILVAAVILVITPILFGTAYLNSIETAVPLEMFVSLIGIVLLPPVFQPEQDDTIRDLVSSKYISTNWVYCIRTVYATILIIIFIVLAVTKMPRAKAFSTGSETKEDQPSLGETFNYLFHNKRYMKGVLCQFIYAGMQTTVWSFTIRLALRLDSHISDAAASTFMIYSYIAWFFGKLVANWFLDRYSITKVLTWFSLLGTISLVITFTVPNITAVIAAIATSFFFGPEWPTIYAHTLDQIHEKKYTETGGAFIVMSLIGGAIVPTIQGRVSDLTGSMQLSFIVPAICFALITIYFWTEHRWEKAHPNEVQEH